MNYPEYVIIDDIKYKINTDFRVAIKCNDIAQDKNINDFERSLAIIYKLYGKQGLDNIEHHKQLLEYALKYLSFGKEIKNSKEHEEPDMDYTKDMDYIEASFMSDFHIDLSQTKMHWWKFYKLVSGLSNSEFGNCCIFNRIRNFRNLDLRDIKDPKQRQKIAKIQEEISLKKKEKQYTKEEQENILNFKKQIGI